MAAAAAGTTVSPTYAMEVTCQQTLCELQYSIRSVLQRVVTALQHAVFLFRGFLTVRHYSALLRAGC